MGDYSLPNVMLEQGGVQAISKSASGQPQRKICVNEKIPAELAAGGPLTNSAAVARHGQELRMDYQLLGAGGQVYQLTGANSSRPPEFAIFKDGKKIASGNFEFG